MKDIDTIEHFISLRAAGCIYKEITAEIGVSRPTLVKWNKKYNYAIEQAEKDMFLELFSQTIQLNEEQMLSDAYIIRKYDKLSDNTQWAEEVKSRALDRLSKIFLNKMENIQLTITKTDRIKTIKFNFKDSYVDRYDYDL